MSQDQTNKLTGTSPPRLEDARLLSGKATYVDDIDVVDARVAVFVRAPVAHARIVSIDTGDARRMDGVIGIFTGADLVAGDVQPLECIRPTKSADGRPFYAPIRHAIAVDTVRHVGEAVALVVAESEAIANDAAELVDVDYDIFEVEIDPRVSKENAFDWEHGDRSAVAGAFVKAARVIETEAINNRILISPLEPRAAVASYDTKSKIYTLEAPTQGVHLVRNLIAPTLGIKEHQLVLRTRDVGGSFGAKLVNLPEQTALLFAARASGRSVKWVATRLENHLTDIAGRDQIGCASMALDSENRILAVRFTNYANLGAYASAIGPSPPTLGFAATMCGPYAIPAVHLTVHGRYTNTAPTDAYRGSGKPESIYLLERLVEKAGRITGLGPVEFRRLNLVQPEQMPYTASNGYCYDCGDFPRVLDKALQHSGWNEFSERRKASSKSGLLRGIGLGLYVHATGVTSKEISTASLDRDGLVVVATGLQSSGQGHETAFTQLVCDRLGIDKNCVKIVQGDSRTTEEGGPTAGSSSLQVGGVTILRAVDDMIDLARRFAARLFQTKTEDVEFANGDFVNRHTGSSIALCDLASKLFEEEGRGCVGSAQLEGNILTVPNGAYVTEVEIDPETGKISILRFTAVDDVGRRLNPQIVDGQIHGGIAQGIGQAIHENVVYEEDSGQMLSGSLMDYGLPRADDLPLFDLFDADIPTGNNPLGMKGAGEIGCIGAPASVVNAIADAIGHDRIDMPVTPEKVWLAVNAKTENTP